MREDRAKEVPGDWKPFASVFVCLGDEERQRIVLAFGPGEELTASAIAQASTLSRPTVSHHLNILHRGGCLKRRKQGREVFYALNADLLEETFSRCLEYVRQKKAQAGVPAAQE